MRTYTLIIYIIFSLILGITLNKLEEEKEDNFLDYIAISNIYILLLSGFFIKHSANIFLVVVFQTIGNILYVTYIKEDFLLVNNTYNITKYTLNIITSYLLNILFINRVDFVFLNSEQVKLVIWILIIWYLYFSIKDNIKIKKLKNNKKYFYQDEEYIVMQYAKLKNKYYKEVNTNIKELIPLIYSIMIYENYNRPKLMRKFDELKYKFSNKKGKFGIMQINSNHYLTDEESIKLAIKKLEKLSNSCKNNVKIIIRKNYRKEVKEIENIYKIINKFNKL